MVGGAVTSPYKSVCLSVCLNQVPTLPALGERCSVLDTVSKRARTPLRSPICVHGQKCLLVDNARDEIASDMCESSVTSKSHGRVCKLIDLVLSSSIEDTVRVVDETDALRTLVFSTGPLTPGAGAPGSSGAGPVAVCGVGACVPVRGAAPRPPAPR